MTRILAAAAASASVRRAMRQTVLLRAVLILCLASVALPPAASADRFYGRYGGSFSFDRELDQTKFGDETRYHLIRREHWTVTIGERILESGESPESSSATYRATIAGSVHIEYEEQFRDYEAQTADGHWEGSGPVRVTINEIGEPDANGIKTSDLSIEMYDDSMTEGLPGQWVDNNPADGETGVYTDPFIPLFDAMIAPNEATARTTDNPSYNSAGGRSWRVGDHGWPATDILANTQGLTYTPPQEEDKEADIVVAEASTIDTVDDGDTFGYVTEFTNAGPSAATGAVFEDEVAGNGTAQRVSSTHGSCVLTGQRIRCELGALGVGETARITVTVKARNTSPEAGAEAEDPDPFGGTAPGAEAAPPLARFARLAATAPFATSSAARTKPSHVKHRGRGRASQPDPNPGNNAVGKANRVTPCEASIKIGLVKAAAGCFRFDKKKKLWVSTGSVRANGLDLVGIGGRPIKILVDPRSGKLFSIGRIDVKVGDTVVYRGPFTFQMKGKKVSIPAKAAAKLKGLPMVGNVALRWTPGNAATVDIKAELPKVLGRVRGAAQLKLSSSKGLEINSIKIERDSLSVKKKLELRDMSLVYDGASRKWTGRVTALPPAPRAPKVKAVIEIKGWKLRRLALSASFPSPGWLMGSGYFLQRIAGDVRTNPFSLGGSMTVTAGPKIFGKHIARIKGNFRLKPPVYTIKGRLDVVGGTLAGDGFVKYSGGRIDLGGRMSFSRGGVGLFGKLKGFVVGTSAFNMSGKAQVSLPGPNVKGDALVSHKGLAACGRTKIFGKRIRIGFGYRWGGKVDVMGRSCDTGRWRGSASGRSAGGDPRFSLPKGLPLAAFALTGDGAPPAVTLAGPNGLSVVTPDDPAAYVETERFLLFRNPEDSTTYIAVADPPAGTWKLDEQSGSAPVTEVRRANGLPAPSVSARVTGRGARRTLRWNATPIAGQRLQFFERAAGSNRLIKATNAARGTARFKPTGKARGKRRIVAVVLQDDLPRSSRIVATYKRAKR